MSGIYTTERAFSDYLTEKETKDLLKTYRYMNLKRFHYSNAAMDINGNYIDFYSYYTRVCTVYVPKNPFLKPSICVYPFIYDIDNFTNSPTTNRQVKKFIKEYINADVSVYEIRRIYKLLRKDEKVQTLKTNGRKDIILKFLDFNFFIEDNAVKQYRSPETKHVYCINKGGYYASSYRG